MKYEILSIAILLLTIITKDIIISLMDEIFGNKLALYHYNFTHAFLALFEVSGL
jgi:hypothetical protein